MARQLRESAASGHNPRWWQVLGSNQRRLSRRFYSTLAPPESPPADQRLRGSRRDCGPPPSAMCPCAGSRWRGDARTGTDGGVRRLRLHAPIRAFVAFDLRRSSCLLAVAVFLSPRLGLGVHGAEGVGDALVGGLSLPVDAVRRSSKGPRRRARPGGRPRWRANGARCSALGSGTSFSFEARVMVAVVRG